MNDDQQTAPRVKHSWEKSRNEWDEFVFKCSKCGCMKKAVKFGTKYKTPTGQLSTKAPECNPTEKQ